MSKCRNSVAPCNDVDVLCTAFLKGQANSRKFLPRNNPSETFFGNLKILAKCAAKVAA